MRFLRDSLEQIFSKYGYNDSSDPHNRESKKRGDIGLLRASLCARKNFGIKPAQARELVFVLVELVLGSSHGGSVNDILKP